MRRGVQRVQRAVLGAQRARGPEGAGVRVCAQGCGCSGPDGEDVFLVAHGEHRPADLVPHLELPPQQREELRPRRRSGEGLRELLIVR